MATAELAAAPSDAKVREFNPWIVALAVIIPTFMEVLDTTIANVALRYMAGDLSAPSSDSEWVITSYLAANAIILPMSGWLSVRLGRRRYFLISIRDKAQKLQSAAPTRSRKTCLKQPYRGHGDASSETDVDVCTMGALAGMIDAIIEQPATFLVPVAERQGMRIERAENDLGVIFGGAEMRQIDVVKQAWFDRPSRELAEDPRHPGGRPLPVKLHLVAAIVRKRHTRPAMQHRLAHCRHGSRIVDISPQIAAVIDATEHPLSIRSKLEQSNARAIRRGSINGKSFLSARFDPKRTVRCDGMADARLRTCWRDHDRLTDRACRAQQRLQAGCVDAVVIAKEELHGTQLDGHKRLSISSRHSYFSDKYPHRKSGVKSREYRVSSRVDSRRSEDVVRR